MCAFARHAPGLAERAARAALADAERAGMGDAAGIHDLITVSCTGVGSPGVDASLVRALGLRPDVRRTHIGFMGCHGAINALRVAQSVVGSRPGARALVVCVELSSLHLIDSRRRDQLVATCLFGDGAAAAVVAGVDDAAASTRDALEVVDTASMLWPEGEAAMAWQVGDHGFEMTLAEGVPDRLMHAVPRWLAPWLASRGTSLEAARVGAAWCVHPGGPKVLDAVAAGLALPEHALDASRSVLRDHGNMSSGTVLFILRAMRARGLSPGRDVLMLAFGPGLAGEAALLRAIG